MLLFNSLINISEASFMVLFIMKYFSLKNQKIYFPLMTVILFLIYTLAEYVFKNNGVFLSLFVMMVIIISLILWTKKILFEFLYVTALYVMLVLIISYFSYIIARLENHYLGYLEINIALVFSVISKIGQMIITLYLIKKNFKLSTHLDVKNWKSIFILATCLISGITLSVYAMIMNNVDVFLVEILSILFVVITVLFVYIINKIEILNLEKIEAIKEKEKNEFSNKQFSMMKFLKKEIDDIDHRMSYVLLQIEFLLKKNQINEALDLLSYYRKEVHKYDLVLDTKNSVFDCLYSLKINEFIRNGITVNTSIFIPQHAGYNDMVFIRMMVSLLDFFKDCNNIYILMNGISHILHIQIIFRQGTVDKKALIDFLKFSFPDKSHLIHDDFEKKGLKIVIDMNQYSL